MKFHRLVLRNFRGVDACDVAFPASGVTIVHGPNEVGKSSLAEAIDLLFDYPDSSGHRAVKAVQPVHHDACTEIILEFSAGPYRALYRKRFHRDRITELRIIAPSPENLTGKDAHDRALAILEDTVDVGLWKALRIQQGAPLDLPRLQGHSALSAALDRAAGQVQAGDAEQSLYAAAQAEYERYYTTQGREKQLLTDSANAVLAAEAEVARIEVELEAVEKDVAESTRLAGELGTLRGELGGLKGAAERAAAAVQELERQEREVALLQSRLETARANHKQAAEAHDARRAQVKRVEAIRAEHEKLLETVVSREPELAERQSRETAARAELDTATDHLEEATAVHRTAVLDLEFHRASIERTLMQERLQRIEAAEADRSRAEEELSRNPVDARLLERLRSAHLDVERARAAAKAGSPTLEIEAVQDIGIEAPGAPAGLEAGGTWTTTVQEPLELAIGSVARVRVSPAVDSRSLHDSLRKAESAFRGLLEGAGVEDLAGGTRAHEIRSDAERVITRAAEVIKENLRDLSTAALVHKIAQQQARIDAFPADRLEKATFPADFDSAQEAERRAAGAVEQARQAVGLAETEHRAARASLETLDREVSETRARSSQQADQLRGEEAVLAEVRGNAADEAFAEALKTAAAELEAARQREAEAAARLQQADPAQQRQLAANAKAAHEGAQQRLTDLQNQRVAVHARLEVAGQKGLADKLGEAKAAAAAKTQADAALRRRAAAARLLFLTLRTRRDEAKRAYVQPLRRQIEGLGRIVFGSTFQVELTDDLAIDSRTLVGRTVPFASLSGGAREQLSMLGRLACAILVAPDGGVPLLFDDALGNSDAERLRALGAVLSIAGEKCQVIVLTCARDRYLNVGGAVHIPLDGAAVTVVAV
jgi:hypothetical protein